VLGVPLGDELIAGLAAEDAGEKLIEKWTALCYETTFQGDGFSCILDTIVQGL